MTEKRRKKVNILMVDDRPENLLALEAILAHESYNLIKANSGEEALKWVLKEEFAVILLDVQMPGIDGFETAKLIKAREQSKNIPIIFVTAINQAKENVTQGYALGAIDFLFKPFNPDALRMKIAGFVNLYKYQKKLELMTTELRKAEVLARIISETSADTIITTDEKGFIIQANPTTRNMFGFKVTELEGEHFTKLLPPMVFFKDLKNTGGFVQCEVIRKDHTKFPAEIQIREANVEKEHLFIISIRDVTERKLIEQERFSKIFNASPDLIDLRKTSDLKLIDVNKSWLSHLGYTKEEVIGRKLEELGIPADGKSTEIFNFNRKKVKNVITKYRTKYGQIRTAILSRELIDINNEKCVLTVMKDITELRKMEEEMSRLDRLNLIGEMAAGIGHEIRNPLTTVRGFLQLMEKRNKESSDSNYYSLMIEELDRANSIITEFLSLAKDKKVEMQKGNLNSIVKAISPLIHADAIKDNKNLIIKREAIPDIMINEHEIRQLIFNLCRNGLDAMNPKGNLTISTYTDANKVILAVADEGTGISPEVLEKIGTPFFTTKNNGTGLGLAICYSIARRHNASIDIKSTKLGTTFNISFAAS